VTVLCAVRHTALLQMMTIGLSLWLPNPSPMRIG